VLCGSTTTSQAQLVEVADNTTPFTTYERMVPLGGNWAMAYRYQGLVVRDDLGQFVRNIPTPVWVTQQGVEWGSMGDIVPSTDGGLFLLGPLFGCDYVGETIFWHLDPVGELVWEREVIGSSFGWLSHLARAPLDRLALIADDEVIITDLDGYEQHRWDIDHGQVIVASWTATNDLVIATSDSLISYSLEGVHLASTNLAGGIRDIVVDGELILVLTANELNVFAASLAILGSFEVPADVGTSNGFVEGADAIIVRTDSALLEWDPNDGFSTLLIPDLAPGQRIVSTWQDGDRIVTAGAIDANDRSSGMFRAYSFDGSTTDRYEDVAVELTLDTVWFEPIFGGPPTNYLYELADVSVRVVNTGPVVLNDVLLSHKEYEYISFGCEPYSRTIRLTDMELGPGEDTTVVMQGLLVTGGTFSSGSLVEAEVCVVAQRPNHVADRDTSNNMACGSGTFMNTVGIEDLQGQGIIVSPNPFSEHIRLNGLTEHQVTITLSDALGRTVYQVSGPGGNLRDLQPPYLPNGQYMLTIRSDNGSLSRKLIRSHQ